MSCPEFLEHLNDRLDGRPAPLSPTLRGHLAACPLCQSREAAARCLDDALHRLPAPGPPHNLTDRIVAGVLQEQRARRSRRLAFAGVAAGIAALAAGLLVALLLTGRPRPLPDLAGREPPSPPIPREPVRDEAPPPREAAPPPPSVHDSMAEATAAAAALTRKAADDTLGPGRALWPSVRLPDAVEALESLDGPDGTAASLRAAGEGVSSSFQPLADSARRALTLFRRELPPRAPEDRSRL